MADSESFSWKSQIGLLSIALVLAVFGGGALYELRSALAEDRQVSPSGPAQLEETHDWEAETVSVDWYWVRTDAEHFSRDSGSQRVWKARGTIHNRDENRLLVVGGVSLALLTVEGFEITTAVADIQSNIPVGGATGIPPGDSWDIYVEGYVPSELLELVTQLDSRGTYEFMGESGEDVESGREG